MPSNPLMPDGCLRAFEALLREQLIARGATPEGADELLEFRARLLAKDEAKRAPTPHQDTP